MLRPKTLLHRHFGHQKQQVSDSAMLLQYKVQLLLAQRMEIAFSNCFAPTFAVPATCHPVQVREEHA